MQRSVWWALGAKLAAGVAFLTTFMGLVIAAETSGPEKNKEVGAVQPGSFQAGKHYKEIVPPQPATVTGIEVLEVFWYGCPHCYDFEPALARWQARQPDDVALRRLPAVFRPSWYLHAKAYYTAEVLGVLDKIHTPLFKALHVDKKTLDDEASLADFFAGFGVDKNEFSQVFSSFTVEGKVEQAKQAIQRFGIDGVPAVVVNSKYLTSASMAGSYDAVLTVVDFLVAREREARATQAPAAPPSGSAQSAPSSPTPP
jgi:protein dithiol oxidoreductase (disulfide-forming)